MDWVLDKFYWGKDMGSNPASVDTETGMLILNPRVWHNFTPFEKKFIIAHEEGHFVNPAGSEMDADLYALKKLAGTEPKSLAKSIATLDKIVNISEERLDNLYYEALKIDAQMGNTEAKEKIRIIEENMAKHKKQWPTGKPYRNADGDDNGEPYQSKVEPGRSHKTNGIVIGNFYISFTNILLIAVIVAIIKTRKQ